MLEIPKSPNDETRLQAAIITAQTLIDEEGLSGKVEELAADIVRHCRSGDGYSMAKDLEKHGWDCDTAIAEILDSHQHTLARAHEDFLRGFQQTHNVQPPIPVGTCVKTRRGTGVIAEVYPHRPMSYAIKQDGDAQAEEPTNRRILLYWDEVEALPLSGAA
ncbi:hypothetical protein [Tautonia plasticadhaerens]|uniref:hypothetical protein n=1 Tax=Tautonia plasticadhaerens TaxID=2527974 RepID=UPI0011A802FC|nr:hypothetical protein [Tautonia plasticadhaerens]